MDQVIRRQSAHIQRTLNNSNKSDRIFYDKKWEWGFLRKQCFNLELEPFYQTYMQRLQRSYLSIFIVLQFVVGGAHSIVLVSVVDDKERIFPEILIYVGAILAVWASLFITFKEDYIRRKPSATYIASFVAVLVMVVADLLIPLYHSLVDFPKPELRPAYAGFVLYAIYIFIPLSENLHALIFGLATTAVYILTFAMITYRLDDQSEIITKTLTDGLFLLCVNAFGMYFRLMKEIAIRTAFLDRRECVEENLLLRYARDQEKNLLLSIIPSNLANDLERDLRERIELIKTENIERDKEKDNNKLSRLSNRDTRKVSVKPRFWRPDTAKLFVNEHHDVTILYADVVNYTYLTTTLDVKNLVETLHELFVKFDQASEEYNCLRIKFLGDCYYCVSGIPQKNDHHAKSCVDLGLRMIRDIREVRTNRNLDIDMRIGVHSGHCLSGVIGACKWQYDVWSKDVDIANRLESTGKAGRVHVSRQTLELLEGFYPYEMGTEEAKKDEVLRRSNIETFLIKQPKKFYISDEHPRQSVGVRRKLESHSRSPKLDASPNFMQSSIEQYNQIWIQAKLEMSSELDKMPIGKFHVSRLWCFGNQGHLTRDEIEERKFRKSVSTFFLLFKDWAWEKQFLKEPDVMLKYSCLAGILTFTGIFILQIINKLSCFFWILDGVLFCVLLLFLPLTWYKKLWIVFSKAPDDETDEPLEPKNIFSKFFYKISDKLMRNFFGRFVIYLLTVGILCVVSLIPLIHCQDDDIKKDDDFYERHRVCLNPWAITESLILTLCMTFLFPRIPYLFKFLIGLIIVISYCWIIMSLYYNIYKESSSTNLGLPAESSHLLIFVISFIVFHLMDRQNEYISKVDYNWKRQLQKKQEDAQVTNETINILVQNILPAHLAKIYLAREMKDELYSEEYENVAIMFATIRNKDIEKVGLNVLNEIICDFDEILTSHNGPLKIEKIKISGWTYMAACGLNPGRCESITSHCNRPVIAGRTSTLLPNGRRSLHLGGGSKRLSYDSPQVPTHKHLTESKSNRERKASSKNIQNPVYVMTEFAVKLMKKLREFDANESFTNGKLRIGISHGEIMAGVVGSSKPLYDVWGNPVNMASRMDTTGIDGRIQVTEETAKVLKSFNIKCEYRGYTFVRGRGEIPTYFVCQDDDLNLIQENLNDNLKPEGYTIAEDVSLSTVESTEDYNSGKNDVTIVINDDTKL
ncbi:adenylyl cyclase X E [Condylostylus longicornis]|uniref:adenylyl cyclase X E n=1 Tax=Condylostylus longicornis TaxID=2530218 RepID=UPI00244DFDFE|nr:adenylyl cyclase X E [Condylostylus longicornis]